MSGSWPGGAGSTVTTPMLAPTVATPADTGTGSATVVTIRSAMVATPWVSTWSTTATNSSQARPVRAERLE